jgi:hypothetical protein
LANAALSGANTVMFDAELSVSTRPAFFTAVTSVDSAGLAEAAVATGAVDMPLKLPAPDFGTDEQAGPKSMTAAAAPDPAAAGAAADPDPVTADDAGPDEPEAGDEEPLELQAAVPRARLTARPDTARRRCFISFTPL